MVKRKICVVTGTRAEYGLLYWLMREIQADAALQLQLIVTGMHLSTEFGLTYQVIESDGFNIDAKIEMLLASDTPVGITKSMGLGLIGFADALANLKPDIVVVLGDRYEILVAAQAALVANIPLAHIHGGEKTEGAIDESIRHSITKMANVHFVANQEYRQRVLQLGEQADKVFAYGAPGLDNVFKLKLLSLAELEQQLDFELTEKFFIITYHPETIHNNSESMQILLKALEMFPEYKLLITKANADSGGRKINAVLDNYASQHPQRVYLTTSLGQLKYLSALSAANVVIGNSSSGIIEAPLLKVPTVNIGARQQGRLKALSIIDCKATQENIVSAINTAISPAHQKLTKQVQSLYGAGNASYQIKEKLKMLSLNNILVKSFQDINCKEGS